MTVLGRQMSQEMDEQPDALARIAGRFDSFVQELRRHGADSRHGLAVLARGSSDNAARVAAYAAQARSGAPVSFLTPSVYTAYGQSPEAYASWLVLALSQSGRTPEIVDLAVSCREAGALVIGVTNDGDSPLAAASDVPVVLGVGEEKAVPATKTVTAQMLAGLAVANALGGPRVAAVELDALAGQARQVLDDGDAVQALGMELAASGALALVGRGFCDAAAFESALKLQETAGIAAHGFSTADFRHGPVHLAHAGVPVIGFAGDGPADDDTRDLIGSLRTDGRLARLVGSGEEADIGLPTTTPELTAILATIRGQQLALAVSRARGVDPDQPEGLSKVTPTV
ncbi:hypothetical protein BHE97_11815 [Aeromicrobium sp. PE09-221]|uniref:SIS domain-containing protein n=1 Tax=Aeromicrobium sp. PE09-221 TaxID=1898043 RepID=UPI000B3E76C3|nr:SIS domain-containing protein [Aeromicrobium sp. PE09-221]OUZ09040.1 hypothetical protein BHE97_11815 [Aeromicrobium sp. PE09-221]